MTVRGRGYVVQSAVLVGALVAWVAGCLLIGIQQRRTRGSARRSDGLGGARATPAMPVPSLPTAGGRPTAAAAEHAPAVAPPITPSPVSVTPFEAEAEADVDVDVVTVPARPATPNRLTVRNGLNNSGSARFGRPRVNGRTGVTAGRTVS
jgi:hypothetical protein